MEMAPSADRTMRYLLTEMPSLNVQPDVKAALNRAARSCGLSREQVVDQANELARRFGLKLGQRGLSTSTLDKLLDPSDSEHRLHMDVVNLLCHVMGDFQALDVLAASHGLGLRVIGPEDAALLAAARREEEVKRIKRDIALIKRHGAAVLPQIDGKNAVQNVAGFCRAQTAKG